MGAPARAVLAVFKEVTGHDSPTCPWWAFYEPRVGAVLRAYDWRDQLSAWWGPDPERWLVDGLQVYRTTLERVRADVIETKRPK